MPFEKEKWSRGEPPARQPERRYDTRPAGPTWTEKEIKEEKQRRQENPNWFREQE